MHPRLYAVLSCSKLFRVSSLGWNTLTHLSPGKLLRPLQDPAQAPLPKASLASHREGWPYTAPNYGVRHSLLHSSVKKLVSLPTSRRNCDSLGDKELILRQCLATSRCSIKANGKDDTIGLSCIRRQASCLKIFALQMNFVEYQNAVARGVVMPKRDSNRWSLTDV